MPRFSHSIPWWEEARSAPISTVAHELGLVRSKGIGPCPACNQGARGSADKRPPIGLRPDGKGWRCFCCQAGGDSLTLAAYALTGDKDLRGEGKRSARAAVRAWFAARGWCEASPEPGDVVTSTPRPRPAPPPAPPPAMPPEPPKPRPEGILDWLASLDRVDADPEVAGYLRGRGIDPVVVADRHLAYAVPVGAAVPTWAYRPPYRLVIPTFDALGTHASARIRRVVDSSSPKSLAPKGCDATGAVFACGLALEVLRRGDRPTWWPSDLPFVVRVVEGEIDFLTVAARTGMEGPALLGIPGSGTWRQDIADRIPFRTVVRIATHQDEPGEKYAHAVARTLRGRGCTLIRERWTSGEKEAA